MRANSASLLYDGACGFCRWWIPLWERTLRRRNITIATLQSPWVIDLLGASEEDRLRDLRLVLADDSQIIGADVYRYVMKRIWWAYPLFLLSTAPGLRRIFDWSYRTFANNRYRVSSACRLP